MDIFPVMPYHPLEPVDPCFEDGYESFLSYFVENGDDRVFSALTVKDVVFGEFLLVTTKGEEVTWCEVRVVGRALYPLDLFA
jgi:hypothetical protein